MIIALTYIKLPGWLFLLRSAEVVLIGLIRYKYCEHKAFVKLYNMFKFLIDQINKSVSRSVPKKLIYQAIEKSDNQSHSSRLGNSMRPFPINLILFLFIE